MALALIKNTFDWDFKGALAQFERARELAPGSGDVLRGYGGLLGQLGRQEEALEVLRKAVALDPLSSMARRFLGLRCAIFGHYDEAEQSLRACIDLNPGTGLAHCFLSLVKSMRGEPAAGLEIAPREPIKEFRLLAETVAHHALGNAAESNRALKALADGFAEHAAYQVAEACAWRGEVDRAFEWLDRAYVQRDPGLPHAITDAFLKPLRSDPRWRPFVEKLGFE